MLSSLQQMFCFWKFTIRKSRAIHKSSSGIRDVERAIIHAKQEIEFDLH